MTKVVWITGASSGIGEALAREYAAAGWTVAVTARRREALEQMATFSSRIHPFAGDVTDAVAMQQVVAGIVQEHGRLDMAILNAGIHQPVEGTALTPEPFRQLLELNVMGTVHCLCAVQPVMAAQTGGGQIAIVSSVAGWTGLPTASAYGASKAALVNMAESLYPDMKKQGIALSLVMPGFVKTPLTDKNTFPMPFRISAEEAATRIRRGMEKKHFLITFPRRFTTGLRLLRLLPYGLLFPLLAKATASRQGGVQPLGQQE